MNDVALSQLRVGLKRECRVLLASLGLEKSIWVSLLSTEELRELRQFLNTLHEERGK